ncbi:MAG: TlpA disulfide reductase family protein [Mariprofundaceae bacterium]|nr:TlpA disulfide reductase family protein [Mariprofundaceae bacterium]
MGTIVAIITAVAWFGLPEAKEKISNGDAALAFTLPDLQGQQYGLPKGDVVLLNFWATWCPPCRQEMPSMIKLSNKYAAKGLKVVAISVDRDTKALKDFVAEYKLPFLVLHDIDSKISGNYGVFRYPETFLIDRQGNIQAHLVGAVEWMSEPIQKNIIDLLNDKAIALKE